MEGRLYAIDNKVDSLYEWGENGPTVITAGDVGYRYLLQVLAQAGRNDVIYAMNSRDDVPGYGIQLKNGATTLTESWQGLERVSNNHLMLGHLMEWLYSGLGGISFQTTPDGIPAWRHIVFSPQMVGDVTWAKTSLDTPQGKVACHWTREPNSNGWTINVSIPEGADGLLRLPDGTTQQLASGSHSFSGRAGIIRQNK